VRHERPELGWRCHSALLPSRRGEFYVVERVDRHLATSDCPTVDGSCGHQNVRDRLSVESSATEFLREIFEVVPADLIEAILSKLGD
jgi:hypothetical protein